MDRKICHEGHCWASRGLPSDADQGLSDGFFYIHHIPMIDTYSCIPFDSPHLIFKVELAIR